MKLFFISIGVMIIMFIADLDLRAHKTRYADFDYTKAAYSRPARFSRESGILAVEFLKPGRRPIENSLLYVPFTPKTWKWLPEENLYARWSSFVKVQDRFDIGKSVNNYDQLISKLKTFGPLSKLVELDADTAILLVGRSVVPIVRLDKDSKYKSSGCYLDDALCRVYNNAEHELIVESPAIIDTEAKKIKQDGNVKLIGLQDGVIVTPSEACNNLLALQRSQEWRDLKVSNQECRQEAFDESVKKLDQFLAGEIPGKTVPLEDYLNL